MPTPIAVKPWDEGVSAGPTASHAGAVVDAMAISPRTVKRDWAMAQGWMKGQLSGASHTRQETER